MSEDSSDVLHLFPIQTASYILAFQFSSWYPRFAPVSIKSTIIRPLSDAFCAYLDDDGVFVPDGADDVPVDTTLSDDQHDDDNDGDDAPPQKNYAFHELDARIRACVSEYGAVFPKLNFSSPKDATWVFPAGSPLKCVSPADVYILLKSSDFIAHDLDPALVFEGCAEPSSMHTHYALELVLRKWYPVDPAREMRCFVRRNLLIGITQRDSNYYEHFNDISTQLKITNTISTFWMTSIQPLWTSPEDYTFDILLTRDLSHAHLIDLNPYSPRTDPLLFTYPDLLTLALKSAAPGLSASSSTRGMLPELRVIGSRTHSAAASNAPPYQHNRIPFEALALSSGRDIAEFAKTFQTQILESMQEPS